jgi:hypothetical protein
MIVWRVHALSNRLKERPLTARESLPYLIAALVAATLVFVFTDWSRPWDRDEFETGVDSLTTVINGLVSVLGLYACYRANGARDGVELVGRVCAIGVVLFVRFVVFGAVALVIWLCLAPYLTSWRPSWEDLDLLSLFVVVLYWTRLRSYVAYVAKGPGRGDVPAA